MCPISRRMKPIAGRQVRLPPTVQPLNRPWRWRPPPWTKSSSKPVVGPSMAWRAWQLRPSIPSPGEGLVSDRFPTSYRTYAVCHGGERISTDWRAQNKVDYCAYVTGLLTSQSRRVFLCFSLQAYYASVTDIYFFFPWTSPGQQSAETQPSPVW